jgi:Uri superfamily endonuclease
MDKGIYCLVFRNPACSVRIGALGPLAFRAGWHIYVGSALGSGGLKRVDRHVSLSGTRDKQPKWHVDYLLTDTYFSLEYTISAVTGDRLECSLARAIGGTEIPGFGCSDCSCGTHLFFRARDPRKEIVKAFRQRGLLATIKSIKSLDAGKDVS